MLRLSFGVLLPFSVAVAAFGCSPSANNEDPGLSGGTGSGATGGSGGVGGATGGSGGSIPITGGGAGLGSGGLVTTGGSAGAASGSGGAGGVNECVGDKSVGEPVPVDVYVMLDISGSMLDPAGTGSKWDAVQAALGAFFNDQASAGLTAAIQYFPQRLAGVPTTCATDAECGAGAPCLMNVCGETPGALVGCDPAIATSCMNPALRDDGPCDADMRCHLSGAACTDAASCVTPAGDLGACGPIGYCTEDPLLPCPGVGQNYGAGCGVCVAATGSFCVHENLCETAPYQTPAVDFTLLPGAAAALTASIASQMPMGDTPTRPALRGAIAHSRDWATANVGHKVVVVLATDGFPTECTGGTAAFGASEQALTDVVAVATEGVTGAPSIQTFVIGVFDQSEANAQANLDRIAVAGGTERAYVIDTAGNVQQGFQDALNQIRTAQFACEFQIPTPPPGKSLDYGQVNFLFTDVGGMSTAYHYVAPDGCTGATNEWHYDVLPSATATPTKITACPATCDALQTYVGGTVQIQLGCITVVS